MGDCVAFRHLYFLGGGLVEPSSIVMPVFDWLRVGFTARVEASTRCTGSRDLPSSRRKQEMSRPEFKQFVTSPI